MSPNRARRTSREAMHAAAAGVDVSSNEGKPKSVQMLKNPRPASFHTYHRDFNNKIDSLQPKQIPTAIWFIAGTLAFLALSVYNAFQFLYATHVD